MNTIIHPEFKSFPDSIYFYVLAVQCKNGKNFTMRFRSILDLDLLTMAELSEFGKTILKTHMRAKAGDDAVNAFIAAGYQLFFVRCDSKEECIATYANVRQALGHYNII